MEQSERLYLPPRVPGQPPASRPRGESPLSPSKPHTDLVLRSKLGTCTHRKPRGARPGSKPGVEVAGSEEPGPCACVALTFPLTFDVCIGFFFLNTKPRCLFSFVPTTALCGDFFLGDNAEGGNRGLGRVPAVDPRQPSPPRPRPLFRETRFRFQPSPGYMCTRLIKYSASPRLPVGPAVLREEGLYDSDRDSLRVAWKPRVGGLSLQLLSLQVPSGSDNGSAGERSPGLLPSRPRWPPSHPPGRCSRSPMFAVSQHPPPVDVTWGRPDRQRSAVDAECLSPQSLNALKSWGLSRTWVEGGPREANWLMGEGDVRC